MKLIAVLILTVAVLLTPGCEQAEHASSGSSGASDMKAKLATYTDFTLTGDLSGLSDNQRKMIPLLIEASKLMDQAFWIQAYGDRQQLLDSLDDAAARRYAEYNYGPWDRLDDNAPFIDGVGPKPAGANFYPADVTKEEVEQAAKDDDALLGQYTMVRRDAEGNLEAQPYHQFFAELVQPAADKLREAAKLAEDPGFKKYLEMRADALLSDDYRPSDMAWMDMKSNKLDVVIGPIENYEDKLFGRKTAFEAYVLIKDTAWSERLAKYSAMLPALQKGMPVPDAYKKEEPGTDSDLNAYDVVYYAGDCNSGSKTIAINLPNDEQVQLAKGTRRLQLKNAMKAKFDKILVPISEMLIAEDQRDKIKFEAFFGNTMFHEVAHGLGIKNTLDGERTVREALQDQGSALEEGKADVLGLYMVTQLLEDGDDTGASLEEHYVTFLASIFRSVRFGAASAHGKANMIRFNFFEQMGAFSRDEASGTYRVDMEKMKQAADALSARILRYQGDGDYDAVKNWVAEIGQVGPQLQADLDRLAEAGIPVDIVFEQGVDVLGL